MLLFIAFVFAVFIPPDDNYLTFLSPSLPTEPPFFPLKVPLLDFINCQSGPGPSGDEEEDERGDLSTHGVVHSTYYDQLVAEAVTRAGWNFKRGSQLFENYGQPNHIYFMYHGFTLSGGMTAPPLGEGERGEEAASLEVDTYLPSSELQPAGVWRKSGSSNGHSTENQWSANGRCRGCSRRLRPPNPRRTLDVARSRCEF